MKVLRRLWARPQPCRCDCYHQHCRWWRRQIFLQLESWPSEPSLHATQRARQEGLWPAVPQARTPESDNSHRPRKTCQLLILLYLVSFSEDGGVRKA